MSNKSKAQLSRELIQANPNKYTSKEISQITGMTISNLKTMLDSYPEIKKLVIDYANGKPKKQELVKDFILANPNKYTYNEIADETGYSITTIRNAILKYPELETLIKKLRNSKVREAMREFILANPNKFTRKELEVKLNTSQSSISKLLSSNPELVSLVLNHDRSKPVKGSTPPRGRRGVQNKIRQLLDEEKGELTKLQVEEILDVSRQNINIFLKENPEYNDYLVVEKTSEERLKEYFSKATTPTTKEQICIRANVSLTTFYKYIKENPEQDVLVSNYVSRKRKGV